MEFDGGGALGMSEGGAQPVHGVQAGLVSAGALVLEHGYLAEQPVDGLLISFVH